MNFKDINFDEWEEITASEYRKLEASETIYIDFKTHQFYFKKKQKFPIEIEAWQYILRVGESGMINIHERKSNLLICSFCSDVEYLYKAVEKSKELRK